jgi:exodeoxyribonuclease VII small subunit
LSGKAEKEITYEEAVGRLEEIVRRLEDEAIPLEESLACFQEGIRLSRYCREKLAEIEYRVEYLLKEEHEWREQAPGGEAAGNSADHGDDH